ncbi:Hypothetical predicted protein [Marmota monax]|uniref:Uncharacterized protein n=1 Tax=Marmota monax TaxID=9995 RepID=A0A5E4CNM4_MARMO|nr:hypothetical protein GHT09_013899 [Marmota monax]VTJ82611.1 Hypothetical predicted protein [Marmota monax]
MNYKACPLVAALSGDRACLSPVLSSLGWGPGLYNERQGPMNYLSWAQFDSRFQSREKAGFLSAHLSKIDHEEKRVMTDKKDLGQGQKGAQSWQLITTPRQLTTGRSGQTGKEEMVQQHPG